MKVIAIDPGNKKSAMVIMDGETLKNAIAEAYAAAAHVKNAWFELPDAVVDSRTAGESEDLAANAKKLADAQKSIDRTFENAVVEAVAANATVEVPNALVEAELDNQMNDFASRLQMSGMSVEQYAQMMGGDLNTMRQAFKPVAEKQALSTLVIAKVAEVEGITVSDEELEAEFAEMAKAYELEIEKIKEMVPTEEIKANLQSRKTVKFLVDNAVAKAE